MSKYSRVRKFQYASTTYQFRYNHEGHTLEYVFQPDDEAIEMEKEFVDSSLDWMREESKANLKSYEETGYMVIHSWLLNEDSWKESPETYMDRASEEIACLC